MYKITAKNRDGEAFTLYDPRSPDLKVLSPNCKVRVNTGGLMTLTVPPGHPYIRKLKKLDTVLTLWQDDEIWFRGRLLNDEYDLYNTRKIEVEGELAYLNDSVQPLYVYHGMSVSEYFTKLLEIHNEQVEEGRRFVPGQVTVTDSNDSLYRQSNYESTMDAMLDKLIDRLGGYLVVRYGADGTRYLDYLKEYGNVNSQPITPSTNLLDLLHTVRGENIATAIIPLGAQLDDAEEIGTVKPRLTISAVNDGKNYVYDAEAVEKWGWIFKTVIHDDITLVENLKRAGYADLEASKYLIGNIEADAVDLHLTNREIERIKLGDMTLFYDLYSGLNTQIVVSGINLPIDDPGDTVFTLGTTYKTMTDHMAGSEKTFEQKIETAKKESATYTDSVVTQKIDTYRTEVNKSLDSISASVTETQTTITTTTENIMDAIEGLREESVSQTQLEEVKSAVVKLSSDNMELRFQQVKSLIDQLGGTVEDNQRLLEQYIRFEGARMSLGRSDSEITAVLTNDKLAFVENGQEVAYISNRTLYITDVHILQRLTFGDADHGLYSLSFGETNTLDFAYEGDD